MLREKLAEGMGHNYYGEPAWPNDLLYIFVVILGTIACCVGLACGPQLGEPADPFATPLEILPEWYFFHTFSAFASSPTSCWACCDGGGAPRPHHRALESINKFQNPFRRPVVAPLCSSSAPSTPSGWASAPPPIDSHHPRRLLNVATRCVVGLFDCKNVGGDCVRARRRRRVYVRAGTARVAESDKW